MNSSVTQRVLQFFTMRMHSWFTTNNESVLDVAGLFLKLIFSDLNKRNIFTKILSVIMRISSVIVLGLCITNFFFVHDIEGFAKTFECAMAGTQTSNDQIFGVSYVYWEIIELVDKRRNFWDAKLIDPEDSCGNKKTQTLALVVANLFGIVLACTYLCYIASFLIFGSIDIWTPNSHPYIANTIITCVLIWGIFSCATALAINLLIAAFCVETMIQFKLVNLRLRQMKYKFTGSNVRKDAVVREIREIARHHAFLLEYWQDIRQAFSVFLFFRTLQTMGTLCMCLFILSAENTSRYNLFRSFTVTGSLMMQMVIIVISAETVNEESSNVFLEVYDTPWNEHGELASYIKIMMIRALAPCTLTAGGFVEINIPMTTAVIKTTFSYYTAIKTMAVTS